MCQGFTNRFNFAQNLRISIRGFGSRAPFGVRGLQLQVDHIPFTLPDGQTQVDDIDLTAIEQLQVIRGASAVQYGNGTGGVIDIVTRDGESLQGYDLRLDTGSNSLFKLSLQAGSLLTYGNGFISLGHINYTGYRQQSQVKKSTLRGKFRLDINDHESLTFITSLMDMPKAQDPGGLTAEQVSFNRKQATFMADHLNSGQQVQQQTIGLIYRDENIPNGYWSANSFATHRDFSQQLPFPGSSLIGYERWFYGGGVELSQNWQADGLPLRFTAGIEFRHQEDDRQRFSITTEKQITDQTADEMQQAESFSAFSLFDWLLSSSFTLTTGFRYDDLILSIDDKLVNSSVGSGQRSYNEWNGNVGISYRVSSKHQWYANISTSYESPTFTEFANPDGTGFNPRLAPQDSVSKEVGIRGQIKASFYDITLFKIHVSNELVPYQIDGMTFYENAGTTNRTGLEIAIQWQLDHQLQWRTALTLADYEFGSFTQLNGESVKGNHVAGLPREQWINQLSWDYLNWRLELETTYTGNFYAENRNVTKISGFWLLNSRVGYSLTSEISLHIGVRNLLSKNYFSNIRVNANVDRDIEIRGYFEPAPERSYYLGFTAQF